jgi:hypothetical protein
VLLTKDDMGKSKLLELMAKSEGSTASAEACAALVDKLCVSSAMIKAAVVSADMFLAMAKPATAAAALKLVEEMGLVVGDEIITSLLAGQATEYHYVDERMDWQSHEDAAVAWGGHLASIHSMEEHEHVSRPLKDKSCWIGGRRIERGRNGPGPEHWEWSDGSPWDFQNWTQDSPKNRENQEDRVHLLRSRGFGWNDVRKDIGQAAVYKRVYNGGPLNSLVLSTEPMAIKLVDSLLAKEPTKLAPAAIIAACTPKATATALKLLEAYPRVELDEASVEPLLAKDSERLKKLALDEKPESHKLVDALCAKSEALKAAVTKFDAPLTV